MARLGDISYNEQEFNRNKQGFVRVPDGTYNVEIVAAEQKWKDEQNATLSITYKVIDGPYADRIIYENLSVVHPNDKVQSIARSALHRICDNISVDWPIVDDDQLLGGLQTITVKTVPSRDGDRTYQNVDKRDALHNMPTRQVNTRYVDKHDRIPGTTEEQSRAAKKDNVPKGARGANLPWA